MIGRLVHTADFERVLATPPRSRSAHFAMHHVMDAPSRAAGKNPRPTAEKLSTELVLHGAEIVDNLSGRHWLGCVIPKRHARRSVSRNMLKRQIRAAMTLHSSGLLPGLWLVRLRSPFAAAQFVSAASVALRDAARDELQQLFTRAAR